MIEEPKITIELTEDQLVYVLTIMEKDRDEELRRKRDGYGRLVHFIWGIIEELERKLHPKP